MTTTAAIYARISQDELGLLKGVDRQLEDARALAKARGWTVVGEYSDNDVSAFNGDVRAGYQRLMADAAAGKFERIVLYQTSRLWRNRSERAPAIDQLGKLRMGVTAVQGPELDLASASGRMLAGILGELDTGESEQKSERVKRAALQRAQEGRASGAVLYGWRREYDSDDAGRIVGFRDVENTEEAAVVREIVDRLLAGDTIRGIADDLEARGAATPSRKPGVRWRHTTVRKLALRPANVALRVHHREVIGPAAWPAIVEQDKHDRVTALLSDPSRKHTRDGSRRHLLTFGVGQCGVCGGPLRVATKGKHRYVLYVCDEKGCTGRRQDKVDELVSAVVIERLSRPDAADLFAGDDDAAREAQARADGIRARLNTAADQYAEGAIDAEQLKRITAKLKPELDDAEGEARRARPPTIPADVDALLGDKAAAAWAALDVHRQHRVLEALGLRVKIMPTRQGPGFEPRDVRIEWVQT